MTVATINIGRYSITIEAVAHNRYIVRYGEQKSESYYDDAACRLGGAIMHSLACEGKLDCPLDPYVSYDDVALDDDTRKQYERDRRADDPAM